MEKMVVTKLYTLLYHDGNMQWYSTGLWETYEKAVEHGENFIARTEGTTFEVKTLITID